MTDDHTKNGAPADTADTELKTIDAETNEIDIPEDDTDNLEEDQDMAYADMNIPGMDGAMFAQVQDMMAKMEKADDDVIDADFKPAE